MKFFKKKNKKYSELQLLLGFEFGVLVSQTLKRKKMEITREHMVKMEEILLKEMSGQSAESFGINMIVLIIAAIQEVFPEMKDTIEVKN